MQFVLIPAWMTAGLAFALISFFQYEEGARVFGCLAALALIGVFYVGLVYVLRRDGTRGELHHTKAWLTILAMYFVVRGVYHTLWSAEAYPWGEFGVLAALAVLLFGWAWYRTTESWRRRRIRNTRQTG